MTRPFLPWIVCFFVLAAPALENVAVLAAQRSAAPSRGRTPPQRRGAPADAGTDEQPARRGRQRGSNTPESQIAEWTERLKTATDDATRAKAYALRGMAYSQLKEYDKAIDDLRESLRLDFGHPTTHMFLSSCYQATNKPIEASIERGWTELFSRQPDRAIAAFDQAIRLDPRSAAAYTGRGKARLQWSQVDAGLADLAKAIEIDPRYGEAYLTRAEHYGKAGDGKRVLADLDAAVRAGSQDPEVFIRRGMARVALGKFEEGIDDLTKVLARQGDRRAALYQRGVAYTMMGQHKKAVADFDKLIELQPNYPAAHAGRALARLAQEDFAGAAADCDEALRVNRHDADAHFMRGRLHLRAPSDEQAYIDAATHIMRAVRLEAALAKPALAELEPILQRRPDFTTALQARGVARYQLGDFKGALDDFDSIVADPHIPTAMAYYDRGMAYYRLKQYDPAARNFDWSIERDPHFLAARIARGQVDYDRGNYEAARKHFQDAASRDRNDLAAQKHLAMAEHRAGRSDYAMETLRRISSIQAGGGQDPEPHYLKGVILAERGDFAAAATEMESAVRFDPTNDLYRKMLKEFQSRRGGRGPTGGMSSEEFGTFLVAGVAFMFVASAMTAGDRPPPSAPIGSSFPFEQPSLLQQAVDYGVIKTGNLPF